MKKDLSRRDFLKISVGMVGVAIMSSSLLTYLLSACSGRPPSISNTGEIEATEFQGTKLMPFFTSIEPLRQEL